MKTKQTTLTDSSTVVHELPRLDVQITESKLREWYIDQRKSMVKIADELDISHSSTLRLLNWAGIERRSAFEQNKERREEIRSREYADPDNLKKLHHEEGKSLAEIGRKYNMVSSGIRYWFDKHDIEVNNGMYDIPEWTLTPKENNSYYGYPLWKGCDGLQIKVHQLSAIAGGADPHKVFSDEYNIDHLNRHPADSRPENLELVTTQEHGRREYKRNMDYYNKFSKEDIKNVIMFMLNPTKYMDG